MSFREGGVGRPMKFRAGDVAWYLIGAESASGVDVSVRQYAVIVDYRPGSVSNLAQYAVIRVSKSVAGALWGPVLWLPPHFLHPTGRRYKRAVPTYRKNLLLNGGHKAHSNCCVHVSIPLGKVRKDGTLVGEEE